MSHSYTDSQRKLQTQYDTAALADRLSERLARDHLQPDDAAFIQSLDMFFLATSDENGQPTCSYKGGEPGFVRVTGPRSLVFPDYDGNGMFLSLGNAASHPSVGLLFIDFEKRQRMRVHGEARLTEAAGIDPPFEGAERAVLINVTRVFPNCPRYIHQRQLTERSPFVPRAGETPPVPGWKRTEWARDVLPANDPARNG